MINSNAILFGVSTFGTTSFRQGIYYTEIPDSDFQEVGLLFSPDFVEVSLLSSSDFVEVSLLSSSDFVEVK